MKSNIVCCICVTGMLLMVMASTPVSANIDTKNFGEGREELYSDSNLTVDVDDIQDWTFDYSYWFDRNVDSLFFEVSTKWIDKTTYNDRFEV